MKFKNLPIIIILLLDFLSGCSRSRTPLLLGEWETGDLRDVAWSPNSRMFAINYWIDNSETNSFVEAFSVETLKSIWVAKNSLAWDLVFTPDGNYIVESNTNIPTFYWRSIENGKIIRKEEYSVSNKGCSGGGQILIANSPKNTALLVNYGDLLGPSWNTHHIVILRQMDFVSGACTELFNYQGTLNLVDINSEGTLIAYGGEGKDDSIVIWDMETTTELCRVPEAKFGRFIPNKNILVVVKNQKTIFIDVSECKKLRELNVSPKPDYENYFAFSPNGDTFAIAKDSLEIRSTSTSEVLAEIPFPNKAVPNSNKLFISGIKFSPDGRYLLIGYYQFDSAKHGKIQLWQLQ